MTGCHPEPSPVTLSCPVVTLSHPWPCGPPGTMNGAGRESVILSVERRISPLASSAIPFVGAWSEGSPGWWAGALPKYREMLRSTLSMTGGGALSMTGGGALSMTGGGALSMTAWGPGSPVAGRGCPVPAGFATTGFGPPALLESDSAVATVSPGDPAPDGAG